MWSFDPFGGATLATAAALYDPCDCLAPDPEPWDPTIYV
jgi:hypothetical protein